MCIFKSQDPREIQQYRATMWERKSQIVPFAVGAFVGVGACLLFTEIKKYKHGKVDSLTSQDGPNQNVEFESRFHN